ncbi:MAG: LapA family protein [Acidimicrobiales bacterium]|jgi:uncharacterized integral membrane protein
MARSDGRTSQVSGGGKREPRDVVRIVVAVVVLALLIGFVLDNSQTVRVGFVFFNANVSLIWVLLIAAFLGALVDRLVVILRQRQKRGATRD